MTSVVVLQVCFTAPGDNRQWQEQTLGSSFFQHSPCRSTGQTWTLLCTVGTNKKSLLVSQTCSFSSAFCPSSARFGRHFGVGAAASAALGSFCVGRSVRDALLSPCLYFDKCPLWSQNALIDLNFFTLWGWEIIFQMSFSIPSANWKLSHFCEELPSSPKDTINRVSFSLSTRNRESVPKTTPALH